jgi:ABC-type transporter Mla MlaB component
MTSSAPHTVGFTIGGPLIRADLPGLYQRVCTLLEQSGAGVVLCDVSGVDPDCVTVEALARLQLGAQRQGCRVRLCRASDELCDLVAFMGLADVLTE